MNSTQELIEKNNLGTGEVRKPSAGKFFQLCGESVAWMRLKQAKRLTCDTYRDKCRLVLIIRFFEETTKRKYIRQVNMANTSKYH